MKSAYVAGGRFKVYEDGTINTVFDGIETPAPISYIGKTGRRYGTVRYIENGRQKMAYIHRLVAGAFIPNPYNLPQVNHIDGNKLNNAVSNLEWVTASKNVQHAYEIGLSNPMATAIPCKYCGTFTKARDEICPKCKLSLNAEANELDRHAKQSDRYSVIDTRFISETEKKYVEQAANGKSVVEIAELFGVSRQCVSAALLQAERKAARGNRPSKTAESQRISLVNKVQKSRKHLEEAKAVLAIAEADYQARLTALETFEKAFFSNDGTENET